MEQIPLGITLTLGGMIAGAALAWGVLRQTVESLKDITKELKSDVAMLRGEVASLRTELAEQRGRADATDRFNPHR